MARKQNPGPVRRAKMVLKIKDTRRRPDPFYSDEDLWWDLLWWRVFPQVELEPHLQQVVNFRLLDQLDEQRKQLKPMELAVGFVRTMTSGTLGPKRTWSAKQAIIEVSKAFGVDEDRLMQAWYRRPDKTKGVTNEATICQMTNRVRFCQMTKYFRFVTILAGSFWF